jgi:hypothetical protein
MEYPRKKRKISLYIGKSSWEMDMAINRSKSFVRTVNGKSIRIIWSHSRAIDGRSGLRSCRKTPGSIHGIILWSCVLPSGYCVFRIGKEKVRVGKDSSKGVYKVPISCLYPLYMLYLSSSNCGFLRCKAIVVFP